MCQGCLQNDAYCLFYSFEYLFHDLDKACQTAGIGPRDAIL